MADPIDEMRAVIAGSFSDPHMVDAFIVVAEVVDTTGEQSLLTWFDGGSGWSRLGMAEWFAERMRQTIDSEQRQEEEEP